MTSIQKLLGHRRLDTTMIYARVHDRTVAEDYYAAMANIEKTLELSHPEEDATPPMGADARKGLWQLVDRLAVPRLGLATRLALVEQMRHLLNGTVPRQAAFPAPAQLGRVSYSSAGE